MASDRQDRQTAPSVGSWRWPGFNRRRGTGHESFEHRLARARLLFLRRREVAANWLALAVALSLYAILGSAGTAHATPLDGVRAGSLLQPAVRDIPKETAVATATSKVMS